MQTYLGLCTMLLHSALRKWSNSWLIDVSCGIYHRRTGVPLNIDARKDSFGFDNIDDYFPDSGICCSYQNKSAVTTVTRQTMCDVKMFVSSKILSSVRHDDHMGRVFNKSQLLAKFTGYFMWTRHPGTFTQVWIKFSCAVKKIQWCLCFAQTL